MIPLSQNYMIHNKRSIIMVPVGQMKPKQYQTCLDFGFSQTSAIKQEHFEEEKALLRLHICKDLLTGEHNTHLEEWEVDEVGHAG